MGFWVTLLNVSTGVADIFLRLSHVPDIIATKTSEKWSNCRSSRWSSTATSAGEIVGILYNIVYYRWSPEEKRKRLRKLYAITFPIWCVVSLYVVLGVSGVFGQTKSEVGTSLGYAGCPFSFSMFASPLATLKHVISTKSSASIPINMCTMILVSTAL
ncbi:hypothetical protein F442_23117 [Phytophthora nicotianae P10297]|uniref:Uncharacterized protein n=1 Tax=Phytophthora nicotianae P10297 TaxID=1317064 RepID=W2XY11_PHYNI|nr:hypothetical protein F442_23117 [Phytophthora nicotianae P10297]